MDNLNKFKIDPLNLPDTDEESIESSGYHQEINTLKIEKLGNRVTIISIIIPCIIIAILAFAYLDMKERVVDVGETKGSQVETLAKKLEEKLNALDVRIAKAKFELDEKLPLIEKKNQALENQLAKISAAKADLKSFQVSIQKLEKKIKSNSGQDKSTLTAVERINRELLAAIKENNVRFKSQSDQIKDEMQLFKEEFDARLLELSVYEQQIGQLSKTTSLLDKQVKTLRKDTDQSVEYKLDQLRLSLEKRLRVLESKSKTPAQASPVIKPKKPAQDSKPKSSGTSSGISSEALTQ